MRADNSHHVIQAARSRAQQTRQRAVTALRRMDAAGQRITFNAVSREAGVSRSWLYAQEDCCPSLKIPMKAALVMPMWGCGKAPPWWCAAGLCGGGAGGCG